MPHSVIRADIQKMTAYQVADLPSDFIKLDAMEVPYQYPEHLQQALAQQLAAAPINRYPNPHTSGLQAALRQAFAMPDTAQIVLGNGSDELIQLLTLLVAQPQATVLSVEPAFVMYRHNAALLGLNYVGVPLREDFTLDTAAMLQAIETHNPALIYLAYPNNPTGVPFARADVEQIIQAAQGIVVIDEAYGAFSDDSFLPQAGQPENMVVLRTLSKIGFAGLRLGYAVGHANIMNELAKITPPYNMNQLSLSAGKFALQHMDWIDEKIAILKQERDKMTAELNSLPETHVFPSQANFITVRLPQAETAFNLLKENKILVKKLHGSHALLENCLRLTLGTPEQNQQVLRVLQQHSDNIQAAKIQPTTTHSESSHNQTWLWLMIAIVVIVFVLAFSFSGSLK
ncbi:histidinol-phosphate transaminase [Alysiella filiformis]|uniref:Histidinol-phosphate aminotransferase n=1 Tax=Alysiella filiformis DSM 16848 TaxID=1120981 RepID=A0A286EAF7_9NEIS|nr:histidinol-phosphate transaminase [Alysiella filiformis]QMT32295.1 histidinol-phosphate transaminase [Alysiella filiformis]UBQ56786.1 histidinol-phosphate transaminase [Alysiella filiformis DSM 16848]SOD67925.1 histidinol-phosphate aminotransferase [Alysiella filiformis DSM 16848]